MTKGGRPAAGGAGGARLRGVARSGASALMTGIDVLGRNVALAALVFSGVLLPGAGAASLMFMLATVVSILLVNLRLERPVVLISSVQNAAIAVLMPSVFAIAAQVGPGFAAEQAVATTFALLSVTTLATGVVLLAVSVFHLGRLVRLMPYPVTAGFLASTGILLILSAGRMLHPGPVDSAAGLLADLRANPMQLVNFALAVTLALALGMATRWRRDLGPLLALVAAIGGVFAALAMIGAEPRTWEELGITAYARLPETSALPGHLADPGSIDWARIAQAAPVIAAAVFISVFGAMMNITGIELAQQTDLNPRGSLWRAGLGNLLTGGAGAAVSFQSSTVSMTAAALGGSPRLTPVLVAGVVLVGAAQAGPLLAWAPRFVTAGILFYVGAITLSGWFLSQRRRQPLVDWLLTGAIVGIAFGFGMLTAIGFGIVAASIIFAVTYARLPVIAQETDLAALRSTVDRGPRDIAELERAGGRVVVFRLEGFLFFGSVEQLIARVRRALARRDPQPDHVILDFRRVSGIDTAAIAAIRKLDNLARLEGVVVTLAGMPDRIDAAIRQQRVRTQEPGSLRRAETLDGALETAEETLLAAATRADGPDDALTTLRALTGDVETARRLLALMTRRTMPAGTRLIARGERTGEVYLLDKGRLSVRADGPDGRPMRLRSFQGGAFVGEIATYAGLPRTADVVAETEASVYCIAPADIDRMVQTDPALAAVWHRAIAATLAERISRTNRLLEEHAK
ncbi:cyclic nucleotide-binding domain-containing protein [Pseudooceanicola aestuarii]|uniref:cyclic nucleotide-binding domain-containing protein n=1 Tax=Pseudooceanicola aestuarii TaxID=2697319 RepID=UPI0013D08424|nr:cyclic nucleotide-binding domain-containing protein [Pseudooceanicola aestuarii]